MSLPSIIIDDITFRLDGYNPPNDNSNRHCLKITSISPSGIQYELYLYQSETSLGLWRLGCWDRNMLYKGTHDYVQQTLIHFTLQDFINKNISKVQEMHFVNEHNELIPEVKESTPYILSNSFPFCFTILKKYQSTREHYIPVHINSVERIVSIEPFNELNAEPTNRCGFWVDSPITHLNRVSESFKLRYNLNKGSIRFLYTDVYNYTDIKTDESQINLRLVSNYFVCQLTSKDSQPDLYLYYMIYNLIDDTGSVEIDSLLKNNMYFPLLLTTDVSISPFGTFNFYVPGAGYICKIFEYKKQSTKVGINISKNHRYIGFIYNDLFPFDEIKID